MERKRLVGNLAYAVSMTLIIIMRVVFASGAVSGLSDTGSEALWSVTVQCVFMGIVPFTIYYIFLRRNGEPRPVATMFDKFGYRRNISAVGWVIVIAVGILSTYLVTCVSSVWYSFISILGYKPVISSPDPPFTIWTLLFELLVTAVLPPLFEEFTNRGLLYNAHEDRENPAGVIVITAAMFALMHTNVTQVFYTFIFGLIAGTLVYTTRSIWPAVVYHFINNFVSVMRSFGRRNDNWLNGLDKAYDWLLGTVYGGIVAAVLFVIIAVFISWLIFELWSIENERRLKRGDLRPSNSGVAAHGRFDDLPLYYAAALNVLATVFTLVWGIIR